MIVGGRFAVLMRHPRFCQQLDAKRAGSSPRVAPAILVSHRLGMNLWGCWRTCGANRAPGERIDAVPLSPQLR